MKFVISSSLLSSRLQMIGRVISPKNNLPILDSFLFDIQDGKLTLTASDNETTLTTVVDLVESDANIRFAVNAKTVQDAIKEIPEQPLDFYVTSNSMEITVEYQNGKYNFMGQAADEYPLPPVMDENNASLCLTSQVLLNCINRALFATADDALRPVMNGIYFDLNEEKITMVATDAHRLVRYANTSVTSAQPVNFILPKKPAQLLRQVLKGSDNVVVNFGAKNATFAFGQTTVVCRQIEGRFPNYNAVIPQNNQNKVIVDRQTIVNACKRVAVFANTGTSLIKLALSENQIKISAQDIDFSTSAEETIVCDYTGMPMAIGFKAPFLIEILSSIASQDVVLALADPARAGLILPSENEENQDLLVLLMPMLLND